MQRLLGVKNDLEAGFSWTLVQRFDEDSPEPACGLDQRAECNSKIAVALAVMHECFSPVMDQRSGINLIHNVIYNRGYALVEHLIQENSSLLLKIKVVLLHLNLLVMQ